MTEQRRPHLDKSPRQRAIDSLGLAAIQFQALESHPPEKLRGFFYGKDFKPVLRQIVSTVETLGAERSANSYLPYRQLTNPETPDSLIASVYSKRAPDSRLSAFLLHAYSLDELQLGIFLPIRTDGELKKRVEPYVVWEGDRASLVEEPALAVQALAELTTRMRSSLQAQEPVLATSMDLAA